MVFLWKLLDFFNNFSVYSITSCLLEPVLTSILTIFAKERYHMQITAPTSILVVSPQLTEEVMKHLTQPGYRVVNVTSASDGLRKMFDEVFELILVSYSQMKEEVIRRIEELARMYNIQVRPLPL